MSSGLDQLFQKIAPSNEQPVAAKATAVKVSTNVTKESTEINSAGFKEKKEEIVKNEKAEVQTKVVTGRPMYVSVDYGATKNMGNFNSAKVNVSVSAPVGLEFTPEIVADIKKQIESCQKIAQEFVEKELRELSQCQM